MEKFQNIQETEIRGSHPELKKEKHKTNKVETCNVKLHKTSVHYAPAEPDPVKRGVIRL